MSMSTQQHEEQTGRMTSPDLHFRTSTCLWGPLQLTLTNHCSGAELGYEAGQAAYHEDSDSALEDAMHRFLETPRYRPRICTPKIIQEWQAMFWLGWTSQLLEKPLPARKTDDQAELRRQSETSHPTRRVRVSVVQGREQQ